MDFGTSLRREASVSTKANIRHIISTKEENDDVEHCKLNSMLIAKANEAARELLGEINTSLSNKQEDNKKQKNEECIPSSAYPTYVLDTNASAPIQSGALVVIYESFDSLSFVYATPGAIYHNKNGDFYHDDFINVLNFGSKLRSRSNEGYGFVYLLRPTSELWARSLPHRTQIVYELDSSNVIFQLNIRPNMVVLESGTGSGAMSTAIMRTIAPYGKLHTYEFNAMRADAAREEFRKNKIDHLVTVHHRDVCGKKDEKDGGFGLGGQVADAIFLDLPEPWLAIPHAAFAMKPNRRICSYSPCIEQAQRCIAAMNEFGFHSIKTIEVRLRENFVDEVELEAPPTAKIVRVSKESIKMMESAESLEHYRKKVEEQQSQAREGGVSQANEVDEDLPTNPEDLRKLKSNYNTKNSKPSSENEGMESMTMIPRKRTKLCARPFNTMKGHTAFLTFATAGNAIYKDPNSNT